MQIIRGLIHNDLASLGLVPNYSIGDFQVLRFLGSGEFGVALAARHKDASGAAEEQRYSDIIVIKRGKIRNDKEAKSKVLQSLQHECEVLRMFPPSCAFLPQLLWRDWKVNKITPYLPITPIGEALFSIRLMILSLQERAEMVPGLIEDLRAATAAALSVGYCHTDIHPHNIIVVKQENARDKFVLIDWGLARVPNALMHDCSGMRAYFHDDLVLAHTANKLTTMPFEPLHDQQSIKYVAFAFATTTVDAESWAWRRCCGDYLIEKRREAFDKWMDDLDEESQSLVFQAMDFVVA